VTLGLGDASVGTEVMWRSGVTMLGPEFSHGLKENLQISVTSPFQHFTLTTASIDRPLYGADAWRRSKSFWVGGSFAHPQGAPHETKPLFMPEPLP